MGVQIQPKDRMYVMVGKDIKIKFIQVKGGRGGWRIDIDAPSEMRIERIYERQLQDSLSRTLPK